MELSPEQIFIVGAIASVIGVIVKLLTAKISGFSISKFWMTIIVSVVSFVLAVVFNLPALPEYLDPIQYVAAWLALISGYLGSATLIYNLLLDKILDKLEFTASRFIK